jgi:hypothetical protein
MRVLAAFLGYALAAIGWDVARPVPGELVATDLHGKRYRIKVTPCE